jgi:polysaccharide pyruvyl transferase WcaK-like protein
MGRKSGQRIAIVGWYGSETVGDVAILGQVLSEWRHVLPRVTITIVSFAPKITQRSLDDIDERKALIAGEGLASCWALVMADWLVFGGGPLMQSPTTFLWLARVIAVKVAGGQVVVHGCGVGPIRTAAMCLAASMILHRADLIMLRDRTIEQWLPRFAGSYHVVFDPAFDYVRSMCESEPRADSGQRSQRVLALFLRWPSKQYLERGTLPEDLVDTIVQALISLTDQMNLLLRACVMHADYPESDDRRIYQHLRRSLRRGVTLDLSSERQALRDIVHAARSSDAVLAIRYHGLVIALATGTPFLAVDYTEPWGKTRSTAERVGMSDHVLSWTQSTAATIADELASVLAHEAHREQARVLDEDFVGQRVELLQMLVERRRDGGYEARAMRSS